MEGDNYEGDNNVRANTSDDYNGPAKRKAETQCVDEQPLPHLDDEWDDDEVEEQCVIDIAEEGILPADWHTFCMSQKENFPYVSAMYEENFNTPARAVDLRNPTSRSNMYLSPTCLEIIRKAYFVARGRKVKRVKFVPPVNVDFPLLLPTDAYQRAAFRARVNDPERKCARCSIPLPPPGALWTGLDRDTGSINYAWPPAVKTFQRDLTRYPEESDAAFFYRSSDFQCDPCFMSHYQDRVNRSFLRYCLSRDQDCPPKHLM